MRHPVLTTLISLLLHQPTTNAGSNELSHHKSPIVQKDKEVLPLPPTEGKFFYMKFKSDGDGKYEGIIKAGDSGEMPVWLST